MASDESSHTLFDLWKIPMLFKFCVALYFIFFTNVLIYYGFTYNAASLGGSLYITQFVNGCAELVESLFLFAILDHVRRKK